MVTNLVKFVRNDDTQTEREPKWSVAKKEELAPSLTRVGSQP